MGITVCGASHQCVLETSRRPQRNLRDFGKILRSPRQSICPAQTTGSFGLPEGCDPAFYRRRSGFSPWRTPHGRAGFAGCAGGQSPPGTAEVSSQWLFRHDALRQRIPQPGRKIQKLLELPPIPGSSKPATRARESASHRRQPSLERRAFMEFRLIREGRPIPREPALLGHRSVSADWSSQAGCRSAVSIE